jgi:CHASE2 domain-containing sensor protein
MWSEEWTEPPLAMPPGVPPAPRRLPPNKGGSNELPHMPFEHSSDDTLSQRLMEIAHAQRHEAASAIQLALHQSASTTVNPQQARANQQPFR